MGSPTRPLAHKHVPHPMSQQSQTLPRPDSASNSSGKVGEHESFLLHERDADGWHVEAGRIDVYAVQLQSDGSLSRRRHLLRVPEGEVLFSTEEPEAGFALLAVGTHETELSSFEKDEFLDVAASNTERATFVATKVDRWVNGLADGALSELPPKDCEKLESTDEQTAVQEGTCVRASDETLWVQHASGHSFFMGQRILSRIESEQTVLPIGDRVWLQTGADSELRTAPTHAMVRDGRIRRGLAAFHQLVLRSVNVRSKHHRRKERTRLERKSEADEAALSESFVHLASIIDEEDPEAAAYTDHPLVAACQAVGEATGLEIDSPVDEEAAGVNGTGREKPLSIEEIARCSGVRSRQVALQGEWWKQDAGPLVGLVVDNEGDSRRPVALLPNGSSGYEAHDPVTGAVETVDETLNQRLHAFGYSFYRPFPNKELSAWDVFKFGAEQCRTDFLMILLMGVATGLLGLLTPIITGVIFNTIIPEAERLQLGQMVAALFACAVATGLFSLVRGLTVLRVESRMEASVQPAVWDRLLKLPTSFFRRFTAGSLASRAGGISEIRRLLSGATISSFLSGLFSVFQLGLLFYYDAGLALWALGLTIVALLVTAGASYGQLYYQRQVAELKDELSGRVLQFITGITKLRVAGAESKAFNLWSKDFGDQRKLQIKARRIGNLLTSFNSAFPTLSLMVIFAVMIMRQDTVMATGSFIAFNSALGTFTSQMLAMTGALVSVLRAVPLYEQAQPILESLPETDQANADPGSLSGDVEVQHVSFRYEDEGPLVLNDLSLSIEPGEFVALVGPSGSGKSTVLRLLLGFEEPETGTIYYDGQELESLDVQAVRRQIGVVLQDGKLMKGDIFTNITGSSRASMEDAWRAAEQAGLAEDIKEMPMGMHTVVQGGGSTLSGGQKQRLLIARAIIDQPRILLFDEATSALDNRTQAIVGESLEQMEATRVAVAHRLSTIIDADRICVMDQGRIVQQGSYGELMEEGGLFEELVKRQLA